MKKQYIAIGISKFEDSRDQIRKFYIDINPDNGISARNYIINNFDSSLDWTFTESSNYIK
jgi:hypothetical protein